MNGDNIVAIIKSPAFTAFVITICALLLMNNAPEMIGKIRALKADASVGTNG